MEIYNILGLNETTEKSTIIDAYQKKRAEISFSPENEEELNRLNIAFEEWNRSSETRIVVSTRTGSTSQKGIDPILSMVSNITDPIGAQEQEVERVNCVFCGTSNPVKAQICAGCGKPISRPCPNCGKYIFIDAEVCPRCATIIKDLDRQRLVDGLMTKQKIQEDRTLSESMHNALEVRHSAYAKWGCGFWLLAIFSISVILGIVLFLLIYFGNVR